MDEDVTELPDGTLLHAPDNALRRIDAVWAFVSVDADGDEGLCAATLPGLGLTPLIAADEARLASLIPVAERLARMSGRRIRLIRLTTREQVRVIEPWSGQGLA